MWSLNWRPCCLNVFKHVCITNQRKQTLIQIWVSFFCSKYYRSHYNDVIMSSTASQITSLMTVYPTVYSGADQRKHQSTGLCAGNSPATGEFPAQRASNAENVFIWWRHHVYLRSWCAVCNIVFSCTVIYQESIVSIHQWTSYHFGHFWWIADLNLICSEYTMYNKCVSNQYLKAHILSNWEHMI